LATFISFFIEYVIASIAYIHAVYGGIQTHGLLDLSLLPYPLDQASRLYLGLAQIITLSGVYCNLGLTLISITFVIAIFQAEGRNFLFQNWLCSVEFLFC
jgi:hypothetical protein